MKSDRTDRLAKAVETGVLNALVKAGGMVGFVWAVSYAPWWTLGALAVAGAVWGLAKVVMWCCERWTQRASNVVMTVCAAGIAAILLATFFGGG